MSTNPVLYAKAQKKKLQLIEVGDVSLTCPTAGKEIHFFYDYPGTPKKILRAQGALVFLES